MAIFRGSPLNDTGLNQFQQINNTPNIYEDRAMGKFGNEPVTSLPGVPNQIDPLALNQVSPTEVISDKAFDQQTISGPINEPIYDRAFSVNELPIEQQVGVGLTPAQQEATRRQLAVLGEQPRGMDYLESLTTGRTPEELTRASQGIEDLGADYYRGYMDRGSYTMGSLELNYPELYEREQAIRAGDIDPYMQQIGDQSIDPYLERVQTRGIDPADIARFQDPYTQQVVDASLQDFDVGADRASNIRRARQAGAGAFGGRQGLYDAQLDAETARQRGGLGAGLRSQAYQQALGAATRQADLGQKADISDQSTMLRGGQTQLQRD